MSKKQIIKLICCVSLFLAGIGIVLFSQQIIQGYKSAIIANGVIGACAGSITAYLIKN